MKRNNNFNFDDSETLEGLTRDKDGLSFLDPVEHITAEQLKEYI